MNQQSVVRLTRVALCLGVWGISGCDDGGADSAGKIQSVDAVCVATGTAPPAGSWVCSAPLTLQCGATPPPVYVADALNPSCAPALLTADALNPHAVGPQVVRVRRQDGQVACETTVTIVGSGLPVLTPKTIQLWPPNHKFHSIAVEDCVSVVDACDPNLNAEFIWASSDEPVDDRGDGHFAPDILFDGCHHVQVRSERQGPKNGRVYKLGVRVVDHAGNAVESQCNVIVDHDQRGVVGADDGESYRITLNGQGGAPSCDGTTDVPPPPRVPDASVPVVVDAGVPQVIGI
jgi:hypothetical protein